MFYIMGCDFEIPYLRDDLSRRFDGHITHLSVSFDHRAFHNGRRSLRPYYRDRLDFYANKIDRTGDE